MEKTLTDVLDEEGYYPNVRRGIVTLIEKYLIEKRKGYPCYGKDPDHMCNSCTWGIRAIDDLLEEVKFEKIKEDEPKYA